MESTWWVRTQLDVIIWLQQHELVSTYQLHHPIALYSLLASGFIAYAAIVAFWCRYPRTGFKLMRILGVSAVVMGCMKMAISWPRPSWLDERVRMLDPTEELSFAFPSGHVFATTAVAGIVALLHPSRAKLPLAMLLVVTMMISRVFTGAHFVHDVIGGAALGTLLVWLEIRLTRMVKGGLEFEHRHPWWGRSLGVIAVASLAIICSTRITLEGRGRAPELLTGFTTCLGLLSIPHLARLFGYVNFDEVLQRLESKDNSSVVWITLRCVLGVVGCVAMQVVKHSNSSWLSRNVELVGDFEAYVLTLTNRMVIDLALGIWVLLIVPAFTTKRPSTPEAIKQSHPKSK